jgi:hypothetical protein
MVQMQILKFNFLRPVTLKQRTDEPSDKSYLFAFDLNTPPPYGITKISSRTPLTVSVPSSALTVMLRVCSSWVHSATLCPSAPHLLNHPSKLLGKRKTEKNQKFCAIVTEQKPEKLISEVLSLVNKTVLGIRDIWVRILIRIPRSVPLNT